MTDSGRINRKRAGHAAGLVLLASLILAACASPRRAPIVYAGNSPAASFSASRTLPPSAPSASAALDLTSLPFDAATTPAILSGQPYSECVPYVRGISGIQIWGDAVTWWTQAASHYIRSSRPAPGSVLVLRGWKDDARGHVSWVREIVSPRMLRVDHANWMRGGEISLNVPVIDVSDANDWSQVRVWHVPGGYWGGRTYDVQGFIHPYRLDGASFSG